MATVTSLAGETRFTLRVVVRAAAVIAQVVPLASSAFTAVECRALVTTSDPFPAWAFALVLINLTLLVFGVLVAFAAGSVIPITFATFANRGELVLFEAFPAVRARKPGVRLAGVATTLSPISLKQ